MPRDLLAERYIDRFVKLVENYQDLEELQKIRDDRRRAANVEFEVMRKEVLAFKQVKERVLEEARAANKSKKRTVRRPLPPQKRATTNRKPKKAVRGGKRVKTAPSVRKLPRKGKR